MIADLQFDKHTRVHTLLLYHTDLVSAIPHTSLAFYSKIASFALIMESGSLVGNFGYLNSE